MRAVVQQPRCGCSGPAGNSSGAARCDELARNRRLAIRRRSAGISLTASLVTLLATGWCGGLGVCEAAGPLLGRRAEAGPLGSGESPPAGRAGEQSGRDGWWCFRGDAQLRGVAAGRLVLPLRLAWTFRPSDVDEGFEATAAVADGTVYVGGWSGRFYAIELPSGSVRWQVQACHGAVRASAAVVDELVLFGDELGTLHALERKTGKERWRFQTEAEVISSPTVVGSRVLVGSYDNHLYCLDLRTGRLIWKFQTEGYVHCTPAVAAGHTFVSGCDARLRVIDLGSGKQVGQLELGGQTGASPALAGDLLYVGHYGGEFLAADWRRLKVLWRFASPRHLPFLSSAALGQELVVVGGSGKLRWQVQCGDDVDSSPVIAGRYVFVGSHDGTVYGIELYSGQVAWRYASGDSLSASPAIGYGRLVIGNEAGKLFCFASKVRQ